MNSSDKSRSVLECRGVTKRFYYYTHRTTTVREWFIRRIHGKPAHVGGAEFVLRDFDFSMEQGEVAALIGPNGSGKSTILRLIAGIYKPTEGTIRVDGRVAAVLELGAGFHPELTGSENISLSAGVMGIAPGEFENLYPEIVEFADIGKFIDTPVKYYSSGMQARLAFAVSMCVRPEIALVDEVLAVGDESFRGKCIERLTSFQDGGGTILVVSHDLNAVRELCHRAVWMDRGTIRMTGDAREVVDAYQAHAAPPEQAPLSPPAFPKE